MKITKEQLYREEDDAQDAFMGDEAISERLARRTSSGDKNNYGSTTYNQGCLITGKSPSSSPAGSRKVTSSSSSALSSKKKAAPLDYSNLHFDPIYAKQDPGEKNPLLGGQSGRVYHDVNMYQFYSAPKRRISSTIQQYHEPPESAEVSQRSRKMILPSTFSDSGRTNPSASTSHTGDVEIVSINSFAAKATIENNQKEHSQRPHLSSGKFSRRLLTTLESASPLTIYSLLFLPLFYALMMSWGGVSWTKWAIPTSSCGDSFHPQAALSCTRSFPSTAATQRSLLHSNSSTNIDYNTVRYSFRVSLTNASYPDHVDAAYLLQLLPALEAAYVRDVNVTTTTAFCLKHAKTYIAYSQPESTPPVAEKLLQVAEDRYERCSAQRRQQTFAITPTSAAHDFSRFLHAVSAIYYEVDVVMSPALPIDSKDSNNELSLQLSFVAASSVFWSAWLRAAQFVVVLAGLGYFLYRIVRHADHHYQQTSLTLQSTASSYHFVFNAIFSKSHFVLPEQYFVVCALTFLLFSLDIGNHVQTLLWWSRVGSFHSWFTFSNEVLSNVAMFGLYFVVLCCVHGLKFNSNQYEERRLILTTRDMLQQQGNHADSAASAQQRTSAQFSSSSSSLLLMQSVHNLYILPHHLRSALFVDFVWKKVSCFFCSSAFIFLYYILLYAKPSTDEYNKDLVNKRAVLMLGRAGMLLLHILWILSILRTNDATSEVLRSIRYVPSRLRQISFHLLNYQVFIGGLALLLFLVSSLYVSKSNPVWQTKQIAQYCWSWWQWMHHQDFYLLLFGLTSFSANTVQFITSYVMGMVMCFAVAFLPIFKEEQLSVEDDDWELQTYIALAGDVHMKNFTRRIPFCLETACILLEASYQTYFPLNQQQHSTWSGPHLDLSRLGLTLHDVFLCSQYHTFGFLSSKSSADGKEEQLVVSFRGSTMENISTDFRFNQIPYPLGEEAASEQSNNIALQSPIHDIPFFLKRLRQHSSATAPLSHNHHDLDVDALTDNVGAKHHIPLIRQTFPRVHVGFWEAYCSIRESYLTGISVALYRYYERHLNDLLLQSITGGEVNPDVNCHIYFCGHSLGAAIATFAAVEFGLNFDPILHAIYLHLLETHSNCAGNNLSTSTSLVTELLGKIPRPKVSYYGYGSPRVGNQAFASLCQSVLPNFFRIAVFGDIVTMVPKILGFYRHIGTAVLLDDNEFGDILIKPSILEQYFYKSNRKSNTVSVVDAGGVAGISNHRLEKYRACLEACFSQQEFEEYLENEKEHFPL